jgi:hypothetical protein
MISVKRKSMEPTMDVKIPQVMTEDEALGTGPERFACQMESRAEN